MFTMSKQQTFLETKPPLSPVQWHALKILATTAEDVRDELIEASGQPIDFAIRIMGAINVEGVQRFDKRVFPKNEQLLALILEAVGEPSRNKIVALLAKRFGDVPLTEREPKTDAELFTRAKVLLERCIFKRPHEQNGRVTGSLKIDLQ
jgi:hypothetical protein